MNAPLSYQGEVIEDWIDRNNHMNDAEYNRVFSETVNDFNNDMGLTNAYRNAHAYTVFTLELHTTYIKEITLGEQFDIRVLLIDLDEKRTHLFLEMYNTSQEIIATHEVMMMGISRKTRKPEPFPKAIMDNFKAYSEAQPKLNPHQSLGHLIHIPEKSFKTKQAQLTQTHLQSRLLDLKDDLKVKLITFNDQKQLYVSGPVTERIHQSFDLATLQGEQNMIEKLEGLLAEMDDEEALDETIMKLFHINKRQLKLVEMQARQHIQDPDSLAGLLNETYRIHGYLNILTQITE
ncbi:thioesterase family protein [Staphylococcus massiliensis]|uniref:thioesterase family protein n=1 Tax=Staphylococcus massiliensis TaxID=555791 RepID=UPI001EE12A84|nr:thioesterase family protein [Staphylococcus massiliensis]MCG3402420.1 thioesterase family protein [Staphylococcus massiliensis]